MLELAPGRGSVRPATVVTESVRSPARRRLISGRRFAAGGRPSTGTASSRRCRRLCGPWRRRDGVTVAAATSANTGDTRVSPGVGSSGLLASRGSVLTQLRAAGDAGDTDGVPGCGLAGPTGPASGSRPRLAAPVFRVFSPVDGRTVRRPVEHGPGCPTGKTCGNGHRVAQVDSSVFQPRLRDACLGLAGVLPSPRRLLA